MKIRIMGTSEECKAFIETVINSVPKEFIRSISGFYPNRRTTYSNEGRVYIEIDNPPQNGGYRSDRLRANLGVFVENPKS